MTESNILHRLRKCLQQEVKKRPLGRKQTSLVKKEPLEKYNPVGGVFVSTRMIKRLQESLRSIDSTIGSVTSSPATSWKFSGSKEHNKDTPLVVSDPESPTEIEDEAAALGRIMARSRHLPCSSFFSSNHVMVNEERSKRIIAPLIRLRELDEIAKEHVERMASQNSLFHTAADELQAKFQRTSRRLGENVSKGESIRIIHRVMMATLADKNNILDRRYTHMGMATARASDGELYLCQVFRG
jgi:uncharacterized protein YkwD